MLRGFLTLGRGCVGSVGRRRGQPDLLPEFVTPGARFCRVGKHVSRGIFSVQLAQDIAELVVGEAIGFGADQKELASGGAEKFEKMSVILLGRNVDVDQSNAKCEGGAMVEVRLDELGPFLRDFAGDFGVSVAGQIGEDELRAWFSRPADFEKVNAAGASRGGTGAGELGADQRIDDARLSHVRTTQEGDLGNGGNREVGNVSSGCQESR